MLSYSELVELVQQGVITGLRDLSQVQGSSIDVRLGNTILYEDHNDHIICLRDREPMKMVKRILSGREDYYDLKPGEFILAHTCEKFNMPDNLSATFHLKSTSARSGIGHLLAVHIDPGFNNSVLTLEIENVTRHHTIRLHWRDMIGQIIFWRHTKVPSGQAYGAKGHYNNDYTVSGVKSFPGENK